MYSIDDKISYLLERNDGKFYQSNRDYVSADFRVVDHEIDTTPIFELDDIAYLLGDIQEDDWRVHIILGNLEIGMVDLPTFIKLAIKGEKL